MVVVVVGADFAAVAQAIVYMSFLTRLKSSMAAAPKSVLCYHVLLSPLLLLQMMSLPVATMLTSDVIGAWSFAMFQSTFWALNSVGCI
eukprot:scaffold73228_cov18-Prasinocladus_malaysianus.AAC.1